MTEEYLFTFGHGHIYPNKFVRIKGDFSSAREKMIEKFGIKWAFQYSAVEEPKLAKYGIFEVTEEDLRRIQMAKSEFL